MSKILSFTQNNVLRGKRVLQKLHKSLKFIRTLMLVLLTQIQSVRRSVVVLLYRLYAEEPISNIGPSV